MWVRRGVEEGERDEEEEGSRARCVGEDGWEGKVGGAGGEVGPPSIWRQCAMNVASILHQSGINLA